MADSFRSVFPLEVPGTPLSSFLLLIVSIKVFVARLYRSSAIRNLLTFPFLEFTLQHDDSGLISLLSLFGSLLKVDQCQKYLLHPLLDFFFDFT